jgi:DNA-binding CsgD family transcriptional regulator
MLKDELREKSRKPGPALAAAEPRRFIDLVPHPACVIDDVRHIHELNERARGLLSGGDQLFMRAGRLHCQSAAPMAELDAFLQRPDRWGTPLSLRFTRRAPARDVLVRVERNALACTKCHDGAPRFLVHLFLPTDHWVIPEELLRSIYGMTAGEARVIHLLLRGSRVTLVAQELGISAETVRTHLKHVMRKLEVSTQMQLIQVLASGPWR